MSRKAPSNAIPADRLGEPHAQLRVATGKLLGGVVFKDGQWVLGLDGRMVGESASAAHVLAILKRAAAIARAEGREVSLVFSATLRAAAHQEAADNGMEFDAFQEHLAAQRNKAEPQEG
ncbi:hypothetical protein [uncultured Arenimonas sp.]|mgnify:FL=1|uniref:hypothetical protein n=1 Tax=uncultured Arenimonas sp. TaxID=546226 RepID=UPI0030DCABC5